MDNTPIQVFIDNGATPSILPLSTYNKHPILQKYPKTKSSIENRQIYFYPQKYHYTNGIAYVRPFDKTLLLEPIEVEFDNKKCCLEIHISSDSTVEFLFANEIILMQDQRA